MPALNFDAGSIAPEAGGIETWPDGWYPVIIVSSDVKGVKGKETEAGYLMLGIQCQDGPYAGKKQFIRFNIYSDSAEAKRIDSGKLSKLCHVCGLPRNIAKSEELHNIPFQIKLGSQKTDRGATLNTHEDYKFANGAELPKGGAHASAVPPGMVPNGAPQMQGGAPNGMTMPPQAQGGVPAGFGAPPQGFGAPPTGMPMPGQAAAPQGGMPAPGQGFPQQGAMPQPGQGFPQQGAPQGGGMPMPGQNFPGAAPQHQGAPQGGFPNAGGMAMPPQGGGFPQQGAMPMPGAGFPQGAAPQPGAFGAPPQGMQPWGGPQQ